MRTPGSEQTLQTCALRNKVGLSSRQKAGEQDVYGLIGCVDTALVWCSFGSVWVKMKLWDSLSHWTRIWDSLTAFAVKL